MHRWLPILLAAALCAGCASLAPADYGLELRVIKMDERLREMLTGSRQRPAVEEQAFLRDSLATLQLLHDRAVAHREQGIESGLVEFLRRRLQALATRKSRVTRGEFRRLAPPIYDLREMESTRSNEYRQVPSGNINDYDGVELGGFEVDSGWRGDRGHGHRGGDAGWRGGRR